MIYIIYTIYTLSVVLLLFLFLFVYSFISDIISHSKKMKTIKELRDFNNNCLDYIDQVNDGDVRLSMASFILENLTNKNCNLEEFKSEFYQKYGKYIPELVTENRDKKINDIIDGTDLS